MHLGMILTSALLAAVVGIGSPVRAGEAPESSGTPEPDVPSPTALEAPSHPGFASPEGAIREYLEGVAHADLERILRTTAVDEMSRAFRFDLLVDRIRAFSPTAPGPAHAPFFADIQEASWIAERLGQVRWLAYSLLAPETLEEAINLAVTTDVDARWADDLQAELDPSRLSSLVVVDIGLPEPELSRHPRNLANLARSASMYGADEQTDRVALFTFEDDLYAVGFSLLRYGAGWKVLSQSSPISGLPFHGVAQPMTREEFADLTSE